MFLMLWLCAAKLSRLADVCFNLGEWLDAVADHLYRPANAQAAHDYLQLSSLAERECALRSVRLALRLGVLPVRGALDLSPTALSQLDDVMLLDLYAQECATFIYPVWLVHPPDPQRASHRLT